MVVEVTGPRTGEAGTFVLCDIDGTLVPHPYFSGLTAEARAAYVVRMARLFAHPRFGVMTGRTLESFERMLSDAGVAPTARPRFLGLEFGAQLFSPRGPLAESTPFRPLSRILDAIGAAVGERPEYASRDDLLTRMARGSMEGFVLEPKALIGQVEWYFADSHLQHSFAELLHGLVNPLLLDEPQVSVQLFPQRVDFLMRGFTPKAGFLERMGEARAHEALGGARRVIALGDEPYDGYMFRYLKELTAAGRLDSVECYSVGKELPYADARLADPAEALDRVERWLARIEKEGDSPTAESAP
jgi:hypothetical protein